MFPSTNKSTEAIEIDIDGCEGRRADENDRKTKVSKYYR